MPLDVALAGDANLVYNFKLVLHVVLPGRYELFGGIEPTRVGLVDCVLGGIGRFAKKLTAILSGRMSTSWPGKVRRQGLARRRREK